MEKRDKKLAWIESFANVMSGLVLSILVIQPIVFGLYDIHLNVGENIGIASIFTAVSILRGYVWRRWFHKKFYKEGLGYEEDTVDSIK